MLLLLAQSIKAWGYLSGLFQVLVFFRPFQMRYWPFSLQLVFYGVPYLEKGVK